MKSDNEIIKIAKNLCNREDAECAIFINGFLAGYKEAFKEIEENDNASTI